MKSKCKCVLFGLGHVFLFCFSLHNLVTQLLYFPSALLGSHAHSCLQDKLDPRGRHSEWHGFQLFSSLIQFSLRLY